MIEVVLWLIALSALLAGLFSPVIVSWVHRDCGRQAPCKGCRFLRYDPGAVYGVRCVKGATSDQCGDFSCFEAR